MSRRRRNHFGSASEFLMPPRENGLLQLPRSSGSVQKAGSDEGQSPCGLPGVSKPGPDLPIRERNTKKATKMLGIIVLILESRTPQIHINVNSYKKYENSSSLVYSKSCSLTSAYHNCGYADFRGGGNGFRCSESIRRVVIREIEGQS